MSDERPTIPRGKYIGEPIYRRRLFHQSEAKDSCQFLDGVRCSSGDLFVPLPRGSASSADRF